MEKSAYWKMYFILISACAFGVGSVFPYILTVQKDLLEKIPLTLPVFFVVQLVQSLVIFSVAILVGLKIFKTVGFSIPYLEAFGFGKKIPNDMTSISITSIKFGILAALLIAILDYAFGFFGLNLLTQNSITIPAWQRFLVAFYGGINEEVLMRLFLMTLMTWIALKINKGNKSDFIYWMAIIVTSILFGLGHLPITASMTQITPLVVLRAILLNSVGGIIFGWLYWKKGLEAAIISHFTADIFLHLLIPTAFSLLSFFG